MTRGRLTRRDALRRGGLGLAGVAAFAAACGGSKRQDGAQSTTGGDALGTPSGRTPKQGGVFRSLFEQADNHLSPYHTGSGLQTYIIPIAFDALWDVRTRGPEAVVMQAAERIEQVDPETYVVQMKASTFQNLPPVNGRPVTAEDVKADVDYIRADRMTTARAFLAEETESVAVVSERTLRIKTVGPRAYFYEGFSKPIVPRELLQGGDLRKEPAIGSGPWQVGQRTPGSALDFDRFDGYRARPEPYFDTRRLVRIADTSAQETAFRSGQLDVWAPPNAQTYKRVQRDMGDGVAGLVEPSLGTIGFAMNPNRAPFNDPRVRQGITRALDRRRIVDVVEFGEGDLIGPVGAGYERAQLPQAELANWLKSDAAEAKQLLTAAGFDFAKTYDFVIRSETADQAAIAPLIKEQLARIDVKTNVIDLPQAEYQQRIAPEPGRYDFALSVVAPGLRQLFRDQHSKSLGLREAMAINDAEVDALIEKSEVTTDEEARNEVYKGIQRALLAKWPAYFPLYGPRSYLLLRKSVQDYNPFGGGQQQAWFDG